jgi:peptidoglycan/xylan/chitin deacetylase (PgdA/CDA1 family)
MGTVTLTFDNGPTVKTTPFVLEALRARDISAWFCLIGTQLQAGREQIDIARETLEQGHHLVNHSLTHGTALGDDPGTEHARREIRDMHLLLDDTLGASGDRWFRPFGRGGEIGTHILSQPAVSELHALGYSLLLWNCVPRDWEDITGWVDVALRTISANDHTVVVLHDLDTGAMDALPGFLDALLGRGDRFSLDLPRSCVPIRNGKVVWPEDEFAALVHAVPAH